MPHQSHYPAHIWPRETLTRHFYVTKIDQFSDFCTVLTSGVEMLVVKPVRSFTLMRIYPRTHKYHIFIDFHTLANGSEVQEHN